VGVLVKEPVPPKEAMTMAEPRPNGADRPRFRWHYLTSPSLQLRFTAILLVCMLGLTVFVGWNTFFTTQSYVFDEITDPNALELFRRMNGILLNRLYIYAALVVVLAVYLSHKFVGPLRRFEKSARELGSGDLRCRVELREGDEFQELKREFNAMAESLRRRVAKDRQRREDLLVRIRRLHAQASSVGHDGAKELREMEQVVSSLTQDFEL
jgi:methyl-accepting chemotaxis protein